VAPGVYWCSRNQAGGVVVANDENAARAVCDTT
jgi:hypothetical protein